MAWDTMSISERGEEEILKHITALNSGTCEVCLHYTNRYTCRKLQLYPLHGVFRLEVRPSTGDNYDRAIPFSPFKQFSCPMYQSLHQPRSKP